MRIFLVLIFLLSSCSEDPIEPLCGNGELIEDGTEQVCLFTSPGTSLTCPSAFPLQTKFSSGARVCAAQSEIPGSLVRKLETMGYIPESDVNNNNGNNPINNGTTNNGTTNNGIVGTPIPIQFHLRFTSATPRDLYIQTSDRTNSVGWFTIRREGKVVKISPPCDFSICGENNAVDCQPTETALFLDQQLTNDLTFDWDGFSYREEEGCLIKEVPEKMGLWNVEFCVADEVIESNVGSILNGDVTCVNEDFIPGMHREVISDFP